MKKHLSEPWFSLVATGKKTYEGRLGTNRDFSEAPVGTVVTWHNDDLGFERTVRVKITGKSRYPSFAAMIRDKGVDKVLPTVPASKGSDVYRQFYPDDRVKQAGVLCIRMKPLQS
nr:ASCH domain protein [Oceanusvirus sp.]